MRIILSRNTATTASSPAGTMSNRVAKRQRISYGSQGPSAASKSQSQQKAESKAEPVEEEPSSSDDASDLSDEEAEEEAADADAEMQKTFRDLVCRRVSRASYNSL